ncbi:MAG: hypothetical protein AAF629_21875 [Chloroflexota bacterium]
MISLTGSIILAFGCLCLLALAALKSTTTSTATERWVGWGVIGLYLVFFIWLGIDRGHIPPLGADEGILSISFFGLTLWASIHQVMPLPRKISTVGLLLITLLTCWGIYLIWRNPVYYGSLPLRLWHLAGSVLVLLGVAALVWLAAISMVLWYDNIQAKSEIQPETTILWITEKLQLIVIYTMFLGAILLISRSWWGWAQLSKAGLASLSLCLFIVAAWWTRFTWPQRRWWMWSLTMLSLLSLIMLLPIIVAL